MTKLERRVRDYAKAHKKHLAVTSLAFMLVILQHRGIKSLNEFLVEKDLFDEYYQFEEDEELV
jgi:hypothetical protein